MMRPWPSLAHSPLLRGVAILGLLLIGAPRPVSAATLLHAVGSTNFYADIISQIGGRYVSVVGIISNPATDPHSYESSTRDAAAIATADLVVQNGLGYDSFMAKLEAASPRQARAVIDVGAALGYKEGDNPHLWYSPTAMPRVAALIAAELARRDPAHRPAYAANLRAFNRALAPWISGLARLRARFRGAPVAVTEPVLGYTLQAAGLDVRTPSSFQLAVQEGTDPAPQDVQAQQSLLTQHKVRALIYNQQAVEPLTVKLLDLARTHHIPIVGVYETMPRSKTYQSWMLAELVALDRALGTGVSTERMT